MENNSSNLRPETETAYCMQIENLKSQIQTQQLAVNIAYKCAKDCRDCLKRFETDAINLKNENRKNIETINTYKNLASLKTAAYETGEKINRQITKALHSAEAKIIENKKDIDMLRVEVSNKEAELKEESIKNIKFRSDAEMEVKRMRLQLDENVLHLSDKTNSCRILSVELISLRNEIKAQTQKYQDLSDEKEQLNADLMQRYFEIQRHHKEITELKEACSDATHSRQMNQELQSKTKNLQDCIHVLENDLKSSKIECDSLKMQLLDAKNTSCGLQDSQIVLNAQIIKLENELSQLSISTLIASIINLENEVNQISSVKFQLTTKLEESDRKCAELQVRCKNKTLDICNLEKKLSTQCARIVHLEYELNKEFEANSASNMSYYQIKLKKINTIAGVNNLITKISSVVVGLLNKLHLTHEAKCFADSV